MNFRFLQKLRAHELSKILSHMSSGSQVLEIGAGAGWQARALAEYGHVVRAIDIASPTQYSGVRVYPVEEYDGRKIPSPERAFDFVISSHVLEHVQNIEELLGEMKRVLKPDGLAIHVMPTSFWRVLTTLLHYPGVVVEVLRSMLRKTIPADASAGGMPSSQSRRSVLDYVKRFFYPHRHGERGNMWSEIYYFSQSYWIDTFRKSGWDIVGISSGHILYSGYTILGGLLPITLRSFLGRYVASSSRIYVLKPRP